MHKVRRIDLKRLNVGERVLGDVAASPFDGVQGGVAIRLPEQAHRIRPHILQHRELGDRGSKSHRRLLQPHHDVIRHGVVVRPATMPPHDIHAQPARALRQQPAHRAWQPDVISRHHAADARELHARGIQKRHAEEHLIVEGAGAEFIAQPCLGVQRSATIKIRHRESRRQQIDLLAQNRITTRTQPAVSKEAPAMRRPASARRIHGHCIARHALPVSQL